MRILHLTAGTGTWHCGSCIRDNALVRAWQAAGHDAHLVPMYLPIVADGMSCSADEPVRFSGVNAYLQQESAFFRALPRWMDAPFASKPILALAGRFGGSTRPEALGAMTVSMLRGEHGHQVKEIGRLLDDLARQPRPDVIVLSNSLLGGLVSPLRDALGVPVVTTVQGELHFLDALDEGRDEAWDLTAQTLALADARIAVSAFAARAMADRTGLAASAFDVVHNGIAIDGYGDPSPPKVPTLGFFARQYAPKGLAVIVEAFLQLRAQGRDLRLAIGGTLNPGDRPEVDAVRRRLDDAGALDDVTFAPNLSAADKRAFLSGLTLFCVPATKDETFGQYNLEAMAAGVPVVAPRRGAVPEVVEGAGGGVLFPPGDIGALVQTLGALLDDPARRAALSAAGRRGVAAGFTAAHMAAGEAEVLARVVARAAA